MVEQWADDFPELEFEAFEKARKIGLMLADVLSMFAPIKIENKSKGRVWASTLTLTRNWVSTCGAWR